MKIRFSALFLLFGLAIPQNSHPFFESGFNSFKNNVQTSLSSLFTTINDHKIAATVSCIGFAATLGGIFYWKYVRIPKSKKTIRTPSNQQQNFSLQQQTEKEKTLQDPIEYKNLWKLASTSPKVAEEQKNLIIQLCQSYTLDSLTFEIPKNSQYFYIKSDKLNQAGRNNKNLMEFHQHYLQSNAHDQIHYKKDLAKNYKIHLMPKSGEDFVSLFEFFIDTLQTNQEFAQKIAGIKFHTSINYKTDEQAIESLQRNFARETYPAIALYPTSSKEDAEFILNYLYINLGHIEGLNVSPRYNIKVTSLIYYAQGDGDYKGEFCLAKDKSSHDLTEYYERNEQGDDDMALYKPDFIQEGTYFNHKLSLSF